MRMTPPRLTSFYRPAIQCPPDMDQPKHLRGIDRRKFPRGGRRVDDRPGFTPLVMVIDPDPDRRHISEAILAKLRFAVAPVESVDKALSVIRSLAPAAIVGHADD